MPVRRKIFRAEESLVPRARNAARPPASSHSRKTDPSAPIAAQLSTPDPGISPIAHAMRELQELLGSAELATWQVLHAAEEIDATADRILGAPHVNHGHASEIRDHAARIYEACHFHDITGQRVAKVLATLAFVEERLTAIGTIWTDLDAGDGRATPTRAGAAMVHGPKIEGDPGHIGQDDIDALFNTKAERAA
jgi:chemotaxis protein CheZ